MIVTNRLTPPTLCPIAVLSCAFVTCPDVTGGGPRDGNTERKYTEAVVRGYLQQRAACRGRAVQREARALLVHFC